ncbi:MAG TPA: hypothetical protein VGC92_14130 [Phenylobacterium sp.]|jgi:hypothetical protein
MRPIGLGLLAALMVAMMAPAVAMAAPAKPAAPPAVSADARKQGMKDAPAIISTANLPCQLSDARLAGKAPADKKTGSLGASVYEVACGAGNIGFLIQVNAAGAPNAFSCLVANYPPDNPDKPANPCILPDNADLKPAVTKITTTAKAPCAPDRIRGIGQTPNNTVFEISCPNGSGYVIMASAPLDVSKPATALNCLAYDTSETNIKCALGTPAARLAQADKFAATAQAGCAVKDRRYIGVLQDGTEGYEFACNDGKGFVAKVNSTGGIAQVLDCAKLTGGGCTLTDTRSAMAEQAGLYTKLATNAGSKCQVSKYAVFPVKDQTEVVELVCSDGAGAIGMFPATGKGKVLDCGHALVAGYKCTLGKADYSPLTADLMKFDKKECQVSSVAAPKKAPDGSIRLEVACSDGLPGYVITYTDAQTPKEAIGCTFAGTCELPTNKKKG